MRMYNYLLSKSFKKNDALFWTLPPKLNLSDLDVNIVFDGNSLTEGVNGAGVNQYFPNKVKDWLTPKVNTLTFNSIGISGYEMTQMYDNFDTRIAPLYDNTKTNILVFGEDANDLLSGNIDAEQNFYLAYEYSKKAKELGFDYVILWTGWYHIDTRYGDTIKNQHKFYLDNVKNSVITSVPWDISVDMRTHNAFRWSQPNSGGSEIYTPPLTAVEQTEQDSYFADYLHLTALGYDKVAEHIQNEGILKLFNF